MLHAFFSQVFFLLISYTKSFSAIVFSGFLVPSVLKIASYFLRYSLLNEHSFHRLLSINLFGWYA